MNDKTYNVLILCTGNSARSILGEALINKLGNGRLIGYSAGSTPAGKVNPFAISLLKNKGYDTDGFRSKSWDEFTGAQAPQIDFVFTVCDNAAGEVCPVWYGQPMQAHWGIPDPAAVEGSDEEKNAAFEKAYEQMHKRISKFVQLPLDCTDKSQDKSQDKDLLKEQLTAIGHMKD